MKLNLWSLLAVDMMMRVIFLGGLFHWLTYPTPVMVVGGYKVQFERSTTHWRLLLCIMDVPTNVHPYSSSPWNGVPAVMSESMRKIFHQWLIEVNCWLGVCYIRTRTGGGLLPRMHRTNWKFMRFPCPPGGITEEADVSWQQGFHWRETFECRSFVPGIVVVQQQQPPATEVALARRISVPWRSSGRRRHGITSLLAICVVWPKYWLHFHFGDNILCISVTKPHHRKWWGVGESST